MPISFPDSKTIYYTPKEPLPTSFIKNCENKKKIVFFKIQFLKFGKRKPKTVFLVYQSVFDRFLFKIQILNENDKSTGLSHGFSDFSFFKILKF
jgi:hypothetical protein